MLFENITKQHILLGIEDFEEQGMPVGFGPSSTYDLVYENKKYPPKAIIAYANYHASGEEIKQNFKGGEGTPCFIALKRNGFKIENKNNKKVNIFFGKISGKFDTNQIEEGYYKSDKSSSWFGSIKIGDYAFIIGGDKIQFWRAREWGEKDGVECLWFDIINNDLEIKLNKFTALKFFKITTNLVVLTSRSARNKAFFKLETLTKLDIDYLSTTNTYKDDELYRKIIIHKDKTFVKDNSEDLQFYYEDEELKFFANDFTQQKIISNYRDNLAFGGSGAIRKDNVIKALKSKALNPSAVFTNEEISMRSIYDTLFCDYKSKNTTKTGENGTRYWLYAPGENASAWDEFYESGIMALGWDDIGDLSQYESRFEIRDALREAYGGDGDKKNDVSANDDFVNKMKVQDIIIVKKGRGELLGYGVVTSDYYFDNNRKEYKSCRKVSWKLKGNWKVDHNLVLKTLTDITTYDTKDNDHDKYYEHLMAIMNNEIIKVPIDMSKIMPTNQIFYGPPGTGKTFYLKNQLFDNYTVRESSITREKYFEDKVSTLTWWQVLALALLETGTVRVNDILENRWVSKKASLSESKNVRATLWGTLQMHTILESKKVQYTQRQSPLIFDKNEDKSWSLLETELKEQAPELYEILEDVNDFKANPDKTIKHYDFVTFHQSFAYEDFVEGIKPILPESDLDEAKDLGYIIEDGVFKNLCTKAKNDPSNRYAIFIDEINRGNVSAIFGELITLIEEDKRTGAKNELSIKLPYSKVDFSVPSNLDIYGTMNTADRSVEALDTALRRRFEFKEMMPDLSVIANEAVNDIELSEVLDTINKRIELLIDRDHTIGHSYFVNVNTPEKLANAFNNKIVPLLQEYFYGDYGKIGLVLGKGFVEKIKNDSIEFASFEYENINDFKTPTYILRQVGKDNIVEVVNTLLGKVETTGN